MISYDYAMWLLIVQYALIIVQCLSSPIMFSVVQDQEDKWPACAKYMVAHQILNTRLQFWMPPVASYLISSKLSRSSGLWFHANKTAIWKAVTSKSNLPIWFWNVICTEMHTQNVHYSGISYIHHRMGHCSHQLVVSYSLQEGKVATIKNLAIQENISQLLKIIHQSEISHLCV